MFHAHKTEFAEKGWMGTFMVKESRNNTKDTSLPFYDILNNSYDSSQASTSYNNNGPDKETTTIGNNNSSAVPISLEKNKRFMFEGG